MTNDKDKLDQNIIDNRNTKHKLENIIENLSKYKIENIENLLTIECSYFIGFLHFLSRILELPLLGFLHFLYCKLTNISTC